MLGNVGEASQRQVDTLFTAGHVFREFIFLVVHFYTVLLRDECLQTQAEVLRQRRK